MLATQYSDHIDRLQSLYERALARQGQDCSAILLHSGSASYYYGDDRGIAFQAYGHFLHWLSVNQPDQFLLLRPGEKPTYYQIVPSDFWHEQDTAVDPLWHDCFNLVRLDSVAALAATLPKSGLVYLGDNPGLAASLGIGAADCNPDSILNILDYQRAYKSEYEILQLREANRLALLGHDAARECFLAGGSEYDAHMAYLTACQILEDEAPYTNIVAIDEKSAVLHYQNKRRGHDGNGRVLLIDAGYRVRSYCSDITRTTASASADGLFKSLLFGMETLERELVAQVAAGKSYIDVHLATLHGVGQLLLDLDICSGSLDSLMAEQITQLFMPHGVGHLLGLNVHDAGGHLQDEEGTLLKPPTHSPALRLTRKLEAGMVFTIEPGCYFIPMLLEPLRDTPRGKLINWSAVDALYGHGGIRIEDNVLVTAAGPENLTRQFEAS